MCLQVVQGSVILNVSILILLLKYKGKKCLLRTMLEFVCLEQNQDSEGERTTGFGSLNYFLRKLKISFPWEKKPGICHLKKIALCQEPTNAVEISLPCV